MHRMPICITIAGSDPSAGAGLQADLKTFAALKCYGMSVLTCSTVQTHDKVYEVLPLPAQHVALQLKTILNTYPIAAIKIGMLGNTEILDAVYEVLRQEAARPIVIDPILKASTGGALSSDEIALSYTGTLLPLATIATPNTDEQCALFCRQPATAQQLDERLGILKSYASEHQTYILAKGGHETTDERTQVVDRLVTPSDELIKEFRHDKVTTRNDHGTGCTLASAICAHLAYKIPMHDAVARSETYLQHVLSSSDGFILPKDDDSARNLSMNHFA